MLVIRRETLAFIIAKAREFDAEVPIEPDAATGSDPALSFSPLRFVSCPSSSSGMALRATRRAPFPRDEEIRAFPTPTSWAQSGTATAAAVTNVHILRQEIIFEL